MRYTVLWRPSAEGALADLWTSATNRDTVGRAADSIDAMLRSVPNEVGESRSGGSRILIVPPLAVYYDVSEADCLVAVWAVWRVGRG